MQEFRPGDTINNRYKVIRKLGAGAMGSVYLCEDLVENNIKLALKVLISENLDDQDVWAKGEYEALTRLRHPNLARVYNFIIQSQQRRAEREIAHFLATRGPLTDDVERELMRRLSGAR